MAGIFVVEDARSGGSVGECGFIGNNYIAQIDTSIMLPPEHQQRGYGARVLGTLYDIWVNYLRNESCVATVWAHNIKAISLVTSAGFSQVGEYTDIYEVCHLVYERHRAEPAT